MKKKTHNINFLIYFISFKCLRLSRLKHVFSIVVIFVILILKKYILKSYKLYFFFINILKRKFSVGFM